jgi:hypothetical protein
MKQTKGSVTAFRNMFVDRSEALHTKKTERRKTGRSAALVKLRNECLLDRCYYYGKYSDKRYRRNSFGFTE